MKQLYRCDYCDFTGIEEEVLKHEECCIHNPHLHTCLTCEHCLQYGYKVECKIDKNIEEGKYIQGCNLYKNGKPEECRIFAKMFGGMFK